MAHARRLGGTLLAIGAVALLAPACGREEPAPQAVDRPPTEVAWAECGDLECATVEVPLDHDRPGEGTVDLAVARRPAEPGADRLGILLVNPGGPGGSGVDAARGTSLPAEVRSRFDVIGWDPRGVGGSTAVACEGAMDRFDAVEPDPDGPVEQATLDDAAASVADACGAASGRLLPHLATQDHVEDMDAIRAALGEERISYAGFSYGTRLGLAYLAAHPDRVRAMVLDSVVDPALTLDGLLRDQAVAFEAALERGLDRCAEAGCADGDPDALLVRVTARVEADPIPAGDGETAGPAELALAVTQAAYAADGVERLVAALEEADAGDGGALRAQADAYRSVAERDAYVALSCVDSAHPEGPAEWRAFAAAVGEVAPTVGRPVANELLPCATWPVPPAPPTGEAPPAGAPVVLLANTGDAATPIAWARAVAGRWDLPLVEVEAEGHIVLDGERDCATDAAAGALLDPGSAPSEACR